MCHTIIYGSAQLQGNVHTHLKRVQDVSRTHMRHVHASTKPHDKAAARLKRVPCPFLPDTGHIQNACWAQQEHMQDASETHAGLV